MIRGIIFDCFGVLYGGSLETLISTCPPNRLQELNDITKQADYGFITSQDYAEELADIFGKTVGEIQELFRTKHIRNSEMIDYIRELKSQGRYTIALLSNVGNGTVEGLLGNELTELFDTVVLSYQEHLAKPNPAIFTLTAERMRLLSGECIMIDDLEINCEGARVTGMQALQHTSNSLTREKLSHILHNNC